MAEQDSGGLIAVLAGHHVDFVLIGGMAAVLQGSPFPTEDIDITPQQSQANLARLSSALESLNARVYTSDMPEGIPFSHDAQSLAAGQIWNLVTDLGRLDISLVPSGTDGFNDLNRDAHDMVVLGIEVRVADLADVIRSKQAANRLKDQRVLPVLREILALRHER